MSSSRVGWIPAKLIGLEIGPMGFLLCKKPILQDRYQRRLPRSGGRGLAESQMEAIVALIELFVQFVVAVIHLGGMIVAGATYGLVHGIAAVRSPSSDATLRRLQKWTLVFLLPGAILAITGVLLIAYFPGKGVGQWLFVGATVLLVVAGVIGERARRKERSLSKDVT
jgi:hypothetical protein